MCVPTCKNLLNRRIEREKDRDRERERGGKGRGKMITKVANLNKFKKKKTFCCCFKNRAFYFPTLVSYLLFKWNRTYGEMVVWLFGCTVCSIFVSILFVLLGNIFIHVFSIFRSTKPKKENLI